MKQNKNINQSFQEEVKGSGSSPPVSASSLSSVRLGKNWILDIRDGMVVCSNCGAELQNLNIKDVSTGCFYCDNECATENVKQNLEADENA